MNMHMRLARPPARARACVRVLVSVHACVRAFIRARACVLACLSVCGVWCLYGGRGASECSCETDRQLVVHKVKAREVRQRGQGVYFAKEIE